MGKVTVSPAETGERLDSFLARRPVVRSRSFAQLLIAKGLVEVDGRVEHKHYHVRAGEIVTFTIPPPVEPLVEPEEIPLDIRYEDDDLIVLSKPAGLVVHPAYGHTSGTLVNALLSHTRRLSTAGGPDRLGIVHRLDKGTSGLMVVAKNDTAHLALSRQFKDRKVKKSYLALVHGRLKEEQGTVETPIGRSVKFRQRMAVTGRPGRMAVTKYRVVRTIDDYSLVEVELLTGRTHQIRVHMAHLRHPIAGDDTYGFKKADREATGAGLSRPFLHAYRLGFTHPRTGEWMEFEDELPEDLKRVLERLERPPAPGSD